MEQTTETNEAAMPDIAGKLVEATQAMGRRCTTSMRSLTDCTPRSTASLRR